MHSAANRVPSPERIARRTVMISFRQAMSSKDFVVTAQLPLGPGSVAKDVFTHCDALREVVDAVQLGDDPAGHPHIAPLAAASLVIEAGMDPIVHFTCRDRNRIALQSDLMGAAALGVTTLVLTRGGKLPATLDEHVQDVFDIGGQRLVATARVLGANRRLIAPPGFFLGSSVTVIEPPDDWTAEGVDSKADAGIKFVQTQPCLDASVLRRYMAALVAQKRLRRISVIVQIPLLDSLDRLHELRRGRRQLLIDDTALQRLERASDVAAEGAKLGADMLREAIEIPGVGGANLLYRGDPDTVVRLAAPV